MQTRFPRSDFRRTRPLGLALLVAPLLALALGSDTGAFDEARKGEAGPTTSSDEAVRAVERTLAALAAQDGERLAQRLVDGQREALAGRYGTTALEALVVHDWYEPRVTLDARTGRAVVRWKAHFQQARFLERFAEQESQAGEKAEAFARELAQRVQRQRQTFRLVRGEQGWRVALPATWASLIERYEFPDAQPEEESAHDAAVAILEAYRDRDAAALAQRIAPSQRDRSVSTAQALLEACEVRSFEVIAAAEGQHRAKVTYRWTTKLNLPAFVRSVEARLVEGESEESQEARREFQELARQHGAAYLDARQRPRQSMLLEKIDGRWYLERIMAETLTDSLTTEGAESPEQAARRTAQSMVTAHHEQMMRMFQPRERGNYWQQFQPLVEALVIDGYEVYRIDTPSDNRSVARVVWNAHFDTEAFVLLVKDLMREQLTSQGLDATQVAREVEAAGRQAEARAEQLNTILSFPRALVVMQEVDERWFLAQISGEMAPPEDEVGLRVPSLPWPGVPRVH